ncbi:MAG: hypothetical protein QXH80_01930 [Candidatus Nanoarchaeia archaeon]
MEHRPHEHIPLLIFGLLAAPLSITQLIDINSALSIGFAAIVAIVASLTAVLAIVYYWRYG